MSSLVAIEKSLYKALVQSARSSYSSNVHDEVPPPELDTVTISRSRYEQLIRISQQFDNLKNSLLKGGVSQESLDLLIGNHEPFIAGDQSSVDKTTMITSRDNVTSRYSPEGTSDADRSLGNGETIPVELKREKRASPNNCSLDDDNEYFFSDGKEDDSQPTESENAPPGQPEQRTVEIRGLPERVTHRDVTNAVRGGALLEIYLRPYDHSARVSFVEPSAAQEFLNHAKRRDVYIQGKRVEVSWSDRQFYLRPYIKQNIDHGASRNLVIRRVHPNISANLIREHLDHIHNLIVIDIRFGQGNAYISTNSVHNAMFARSCMMSRTTYRGMRIEFAPDECTQALPKVAKIPPKIEPKASFKTANHVPNRFQMLSLDGSENSDDSDKDDDDGEASMPISYRPVDLGKIDWRHHSIAV
ncbi:hypothetical protein VTN77DRAFT_1788 [Rasamsonia byssochlamydoides]|uniref:uncharacterized protein n=1 Tax=Rasamsonia byssochlamydoides TaxID=89139 RepID=UPI003743B719